MSRLIIWSFVTLLIKCVTEKVSCGVIINGRFLLSANDFILSFGIYPPVTKIAQPFSNDISIIFGRLPIINNVPFLICFPTCSESIAPIAKS